MKCWNCKFKQECEMVQPKDECDLWMPENKEEENDN